MKLIIRESGQYAVQPSEKPSREKGKVLFRVKACGVCGSDVPRIFAGKSYYYPIVLGHEFSGVVEDAEDKALIGLRAAVFPIVPCGECEFCRAKRYANCQHYSYYGSRTDGGMQTYLNLSPFHLVPIPDGISYATAAMTEPCAVCLHAVKKADLNEKSRVKVFGAGTIGLLIAMWAKAMGAESVTVQDIDPQKNAFAEEIGFCVKSDVVPNVIFDATGAAEAVCDAVREIEAFGRIVLVGNASRDITLPVSVYSQILRKQLTFTGSWNSDYRPEDNDWADSLAAMANGSIHPEKLITSRFGLSHGAEALDRIRDHRFDNKIMLEDDE